MRAKHAMSFSLCTYIKTYAAGRVKRVRAVYLILSADILSVRYYKGAAGYEVVFDSGLRCANAVIKAQSAAEQPVILPVQHFLKARGGAGCILLDHIALKAPVCLCKLLYPRKVPPVLGNKILNQANAVFNRFFDFTDKLTLAVVRRIRKSDHIPRVGAISAIVLRRIQILLAAFGGGQQFLCQKALNKTRITLNFHAFLFPLCAHCIQG